MSAASTRTALSRRPRKHALGPARRGRATRARILRAARRLFHRHGYRNVRLSDIARAARLSSGAPYQHFTGKDQIFEEVSREFGHAVSRRMGRSLPRGGKPPQRLEDLYMALFTALEAEADLFHIFREAEFAVGRSPYEALAPVIDRLELAVPAGLAPEVQRTLAWCLYAIADFQAIMPLLWGQDELDSEGVARGLARIAQVGLDTGTERGDRRIPVHSGGPTPQGEARGEATRERILAAGERLFTERGFAGTTLEALAREADLTTSGLLLHFPSREAVLIEVVRKIRSDLEASARRSATHLQDRRDIEESSLRTFFQFLEDHPGVYRVVREAEFVAPEVGRDYYLSLVEPYAAGLARGIDAGQLRPHDAVQLARALMGLGHWMGLHSRLEDSLGPAATLALTSQFMHHGLAGFTSSE